MPPISTYTPSSAVGAGTRASVEAGVGGSGAQVILSLKAMGGSEKQRTHDVRDTFHFLFHCFVCQVAFCRSGHFYVKHSF